MISSITIVLSDSGEHKRTDTYVDRIDGYCQKEGTKHRPLGALLLFQSWLELSYVAVCYTSIIDFVGQAYLLSRMFLVGKFQLLSKMPQIERVQLGRIAHTTSAGQKLAAHSHA